MMKLNILTLLVSALAVMAFGFVRAEDSSIDERHVAILGDSNFTTTLEGSKYALVRAWENSAPGTRSRIDRDYGLGSRHIWPFNSIAGVVIFSNIFRMNC